MKCKKHIYSEEKKKCLSCGAGQNHLRLLNPKGEAKGGASTFLFVVENARHILRSIGSMEN
jgi:hypothetical protein